MALEVILGTIAAIGTLTSVVFGGGLLKTAIAHSNDLAVQKHELGQTRDKTHLNENEIKRITIEQALQGRDIVMFGEHVKKLEMLPQINNKLETLSVVMEHVREQIKEFRAERLGGGKSPTQ